VTDGRARVGLGTYAFFWQRSDRAPQPLTIDDMLRRTAERGIGLFQICDDERVAELTDGGLRDLRTLAGDLGLALELGTRGVDPGRLSRYLELARALDAPLVRSMVPRGADAEAALRAALPAYEDAGVTLALETYEQLPTRELVALVETIASPSLGICLDPANCVAALESPADVIAMCAPYVRDIHVKDAAFARRDGWVGFTFSGAPAGTGQIDLPAVLAVAPGAARIVEHWLPWQGDPETTIAREEEWTTATLRYLEEHA
jgi:sugar phosphate isomerase/epimerase